MTPLPRVAFVAASCCSAVFASSCGASSPSAAPRTSEPAVDGGADASLAPDGSEAEASIDSGTAPIEAGPPVPDAGFVYRPIPIDLTQAPYCVPNVDPDPTRHFSTTANYPLYGSVDADNEVTYPFPTNSGAPLPAGLTWDASVKVVNRWDTVMGTSTHDSNVRTLNDVYQYFFTITNTGGQALTYTNLDPEADGTGGARSSRARHYCDPADPANTINVLADGVELDATCDGSGCVAVDGNGAHIFSGLLRVPGVGFEPDRTVTIVAKYGSGPHAWPSLWSWLTTQFSPGTGRNAYQGWVTTDAGGFVPGPSALYAPPQCGSNCGNQLLELDINDGFFTNGALGAQQMLTGAPSFLEDPNAKVTVCKTDQGFSCPYSVPGTVGGSGPLAQVKLPSSIDCTTQFCDYTMSWSATTKLVSFFIGPSGQPSVLATQFEIDPTLMPTYPSNVGLGDAGPVPTLPAISIMMVNEAVSNFNNPQFPLTLDDGIPAGNGKIRGWGLEIQRVSLWDGVASGS